MRTRGFQLSRRFAILASLAMVCGLFPAVNGVRPAAAAQVQAVPEGPDELEAFPADRDPIKVGLRWADNSSNENGFEIERRVFTEDDENEYEKIGAVGPNVTQFEDGNIRHGVQYEYRVRAFNEDGPSFYSNSVVAFFGNPSKIKVQPTKIDYGSVRPGSTRNRKFTIRNTGEATVTVTVAMADEGGPFTITENGGELTLEPGTSKKVTVQYAPTELGRDSAQVSVNMGDIELRVRLRGRSSQGRGRR